MIIYRKGNAINPIESGKKMIFHVNNSIGAWGAGFVIPLGERFPEVKKAYLEWHSGLSPKYSSQFELGEIQIVTTSRKDICVANMIAQKGCGYYYDLPPFRPDSFEECLIRLNSILTKFSFDYLIGPRLGCGISGGSWDIVSGIINKRITIPVVIYDREVDNWPNTIYEKGN